jgi:hypothetical protein
MLCNIKKDENELFIYKKSLNPFKNSEKVIKNRYCKII